MIERIKKQFVDVGYSQAEADSFTAIINANAKMWAHLMKRPIDEYYEKYVFDIRKGEAPGATGHFRILHQYAGSIAQTAALDKLVLAQDLAARGVDGEETRKRLGWFQGVDGKWRFEIDDSRAVFGGPMGEMVARRHLSYGDMCKYVSDRLNLDRPIHLKDILDHPDLYAAYPRLKDIGVTALPGKYMGDRWAYMSAGRGVYNLYVNEELAAFIAHRAIHHEIQHVIQHLEDFARGTSPERVLEERAGVEHEKLRKAMAESPAVAQAFRVLNEYRIELNDRYGVEWGASASAEELECFNELEASLLSAEGGMAIMDADFEKRCFLDAADNQDTREREYYDTAGGIEARDVADRVTLSSEKRTEFAPNLRHGAFIVWGNSETTYNVASVAPTADSAYELWNNLGIRSPFFQNWFGDSVMVDEKGEPLILYHGTSSNFDEFKPGRARGIYFTEDLPYARSHGQRIVEVYLKITKLCDLTDIESQTTQGIIRQFNDVGGWDWNEDVMVDRVSSDFDPLLDATWELFDNPEFDLQKILQDKGYDGVKLNEEGETTSYVVFNPEQVKSVNNLGLFTPEDARILYQSRAATNGFPAWAGFGDRKIREHAAYGRHFARIQIDDFLHLTTGVHETEAFLREQGPRISNIKPYHEVTKEFDPAEFDQLPEYAVPFLSVDVNTGEVMAHEGRHRAVLLKDAGATTMPIMVKARGKGDRNKLPDIWIGQFDELRAVEAPVSIESRQPIENIRRVVGEEFLYQTATDETKLGMVQIARSGHSVLAFFDGMDVSTGVHELMHVFRQLLEDMAMSEDAPEQVCEDWLTACRFVGARLGGIWTEGQEEKFARAGEAYFAEGVAPSPELARVFEQFKKWLTNLFENIFEKRPELDDGIGGVFDRLFVAPEEESVSARMM